MMFAHDPDSEEVLKGECFCVEFKIYILYISPL